jgi:AcrR family transcriptional regulator
VSNAGETQTRILEAAWRLSREHGTGAVTMGEIATAAGVSRQLVYFHFANRAGLLVAMARHHDVRSGFRDRVAATRELPPADGLAALIRAWHGYLPEILSVAEELEAALLTDEDGAEVWRDRMGDLREAFRLAVARVHLAPGWTVDAAADWAWARCQPTNWRHLVGERGWDPEDYVRRTTESILGELVRGSEPLTAKQANV